MARFKGLSIWKTSKTRLLIKKNKKNKLFYKFMYYSKNSENSPYFYASLKL